MSYGLLGLRRQMEGEAIGGLQTLADQQSQQKMHNDNLKQAEKQQRMNAVGTGAAVGMMAGAKMGSVGGPMGAAIGAGVGLLASAIF